MTEEEREGRKNVECRKQNNENGKVKIKVINT